MTDLIQFAFVAGEISPSFHGRSDLEKYDLALDEALNWFVDYRGGISTRPGLEFIDYIMEDDKPIKLFDFKFSADIEDSYLIMLGHEYVRFVQDGAYVLETGQSITSVSQAATAVLTKNAHGYSDGDWVKLYDIGGMTDLEAQTFVVTASTANTFELWFPTGQAFDSSALTAFTSGTMARVYTVDSPYDSADFDTLQLQQIRDFIRLTHNDYEIHNLIRIDHDDWELEPEDFDNPLPIVTGLFLDTTAAGSWAVGYAITAVDFEGNESFTSFVGGGTFTENPAVAPASIYVTWDYTETIDYFNIYRSRFIHSSVFTPLSRSVEVGYIGRSYGKHFADSGIIPEFGIQPPRDRNPFVDGSILRVNVTAGGTGHTSSSTFTISDPDGSGFVGQIILQTDDSGAANWPIAGILIIDAGSGYTNPSGVVGVAGAGATFTFEVNPNSGNHPACCAIFQQRQLYGATDNYPLTVFGSRPGRLSNFSQSEVITAGDPYQHTLDAESYTPLRHLIPSQGGCLLFTQDGIWLLTADDGVVTPLNANADPKSFGGSAVLPPLKVESDLLYVEGKLNTIRMLSFNDVTQERFYSGRDISVLANHLISAVSQIVSWGYASDPFKQVLAVREDGVALAFTVLKEQEIYAWSRYTTQGLFEAVRNVQEGRNDRTYFVVKRYINGRWTKFLERQVVRQFEHLEEAFCVDCGLALAESNPAATLQLAAATGTGIVATASAAVFALGDVGKVIRAGGGKATITGYTDTTHVTVSISSERPFPMIPETTQPLPFVEGDWSMDAGQTVLRGLYHLEGETVSVLADGNVVTGLVVEDGQVTLPQAATRISIGLGYTCRLKSLPINIHSSRAMTEAQRKRLPAIAVRYKDSRGVQIGSKSYDRLYEHKERTTEPWGEATRAQTGVRRISVAPRWDRDGRIYCEQSYPLPATILGFVPSVEVGDDSD